MDMLEACHPEWTLDGQPDVEGWKAEFALWSVLASPIILGTPPHTHTLRRFLSLVVQTFQRSKVLLAQATISAR